MDFLFPELKPIRDDLPGYIQFVKWMLGSMFILQLVILVILGLGIYAARNVKLVKNRQTSHMEVRHLFVRVCGHRLT